MGQCEHAVLRVCSLAVRLTGPELRETVRVDLADGGKRVWREREHVGRQSGVHLVPMHGTRGLYTPRCARAGVERPENRRAGRCLRGRSGGPQ